MQLTFDYIQQVTRTWLEHGGSGKVELAALEPLLWRDGPYQLPDLVVELKRLGCQVSLPWIPTPGVHYGEKPPGWS